LTATLTLVSFRVARDSPGVGNPFATIRVNGCQAFDSGFVAIN
jgi:hypothetical protein